MTSDLQKIRDQLDSLDEDLQQLLSKRAQLAQQVAKIKTASGEQVLFYRPEREAQIMQLVSARNQGPLPDAALVNIYRAIISACRAIQYPLKVAFLGPEGTYSQVAALQHFGAEITEIPRHTIKDIFTELQTGQADYAVVPIENSTQGIILPTLECLMQSTVSIVGEIILPIHHHLLRNQEDQTPLRRIYAHEQTLAQCRHWLDKHMPTIEKISVSSNGYAAKRTKTELGAAAIAGNAAAEKYQLQKVMQDIQDHPDNSTRFIVLGKEKVAMTGVDKTSLLIAGKNKPGALLALLQPFAKHEVNLTLIESRPYQHQQWQTIFLIDLEGHCDQAPVKAALNEIQQLPVMLTVLGSYPRQQFPL